MGGTVEWWLSINFVNDVLTPRQPCYVHYNHFGDSVENFYQRNYQLNTFQSIMFVPYVTYQVATAKKTESTTQDCIGHKGRYKVQEGEWPNHILFQGKLLPLQV